MSDPVQLGGLRKRGSLDDHNERLAHEIKKSTGSGGKLKSKGPWNSFALFSVALAIFPLVAYAASKQYIFNGNALYAGICAVVTLNIVLISYIVFAAYEEYVENK